MKLLYLFTFCILFSSNGLSQKYSEATPIIRISPTYPAEQLKLKQEGWVKIQFNISPTGSVENPVVTDSYPQKVFDHSAINAILKFKFKPRVIEGQAVTAEASQIIEFQLPKNQSFNVDVDLSNYQDSALKFELKSLKVKKNYQNTLAVINTISDTTIHKIKLPISIKQRGYMAHSKNSPYLFFYHSTGKKSGKIKVYDKKDLALIHDIETEGLTYTRYQLQNHYFFEVSPDPNNLLAFMGSVKKPSLYVLNGTTGQLSKKMVFEKNTLLKGHSNMKQLWARRVSDTGKASAKFNKKIKNKLKFINTENFEIFREINLTQTLISAKYWEDVVVLTFEYKNSIDQYRAMILNLNNNILYDDFYSSDLPELMSVEGPYRSLILVGQSSGDDKHLKIVKFHNNEMKDVSNKNIKIKYNDINFKHDETGYRMFVYGKKSFAAIDINDTEKFKIIQVPMNVTDGFFNHEFTQVYLKEESGSEVALVDISQAKFIAKEKTGSPDKKFGQALASVFTMALTAPTGYMVTPLGGFRRSDIKLFLNGEGNRIYAINKKTNDVTSFDASDMSDKHIVATGKGTFQIVQATHEPNLPVVVIGMKKVTFMNASDGRMIKQVEYDEPLEISQNHELTYKKGNQFLSISLAYISN